MRTLRAIWRTPRIWRYATVAAVMFTLGGTGTALAASTGLTQLVYQAGANTFIAHIDSSGNLAVNDSAAGTALGTANGHLGNLETAAGTTNGDLSSINTKLGGTLTVGIAGTPTVLNGDKTVEVASGQLDMTPSLTLPNPGNAISAADTSAYRYLELYITTGGDAGSCDAFTGDPRGSGIYSLDSISLTGTTVIRKYDPAPLNFYLTCYSASILGTTYYYMLLGRP